MTTNTIFEVNSQDEISKQEKTPLLTSSDDSFDITETDRIKELNLNEYETFLGKTCLKIPLSIFNHLLVGEIGEIPPKTRYHPRKKKSKSSTNNTNLLNLPDQILINIFEYLPPLKIIILRQTCIKCSNLSQDRQLWRQVCINNNQLFIWKELRIKIVFFNEQNIIYGFQNDLVEKITGKKIKIRKNMYNRTFRNKLLDTKTSELEPLTNANIRISYIETLKNPEKHFKLKYKKLQHAKQQIQNLAEQNDEQDLKFQKQSMFRKRVIKTLWYPVLLLSYSYILFTILINLTVSKKLQNTNKFWSGLGLRPAIKLSVYHSEARYYVNFFE
ncbi:f-box only protein [Anaeramoeba flamelloides]|uniref:F-box only protein n=1 Tax=Anaeramoeba flamelloides TaxID=1746091 RepID=A0ABQ8XC62_9EUKA|nr:f-box only protein [Anaeramoeba flamelloides]